MLKSDDSADQFLLTSGNSIVVLYGFLVIANIMIDMLLRKIAKVINAEPIITANMNRVDIVVSIIKWKIRTLHNR